MRGRVGSDGLTDEKVEVEKGKIKEYRVTMRVTFVLED